VLLDAVGRQEFQELIEAQALVADRVEHHGGARKRGE
jgi:hypothetical protein